MHLFNPTFAKLSFNIFNENPVKVINPKTQLYINPF